MISNHGYQKTLQLPTELESVSAGYRLEFEVNREGDSVRVIGSQGTELPDTSFLSERPIHRLKQLFKDSYFSRVFGNLVQACLVFHQFEVYFASSAFTSVSGWRWIKYDQLCSETVTIILAISYRKRSNYTGLSASCPQRALIQTDMVLHGH